MTTAAPPPRAPLDENPDTALVERARAGDRTAFAWVHARYAPMVHSIVLSHGPAREAADLTQEVFARALGTIERLREAASVGAWLAGIARNVARECVRARRPAAPLEENAALAPAGRDVAALDEAHRILAAIRALPEAYRETLTMRLVGEMTGPEIAAKTGLTHGSVRVNLHRGMKLLVEELGRRGLR